MFTYKLLVFDLCLKMRPLIYINTHAFTLHTFIWTQMYYKSHKKHNLFWKVLILLVILVATLGALVIDQVATTRYCTNTKQKDNPYPKSFTYLCAV